MTASIVRTHWLSTAAFGILLLTFPVSLHAQKFEEPYRIEADGKAIDTKVGHAAPFVADFDGDGLNDLLVGQFGDGILKIYRNTGSNSQPKYSAGVEFMDGSDGDGRVPTG